MKESMQKQTIQISAMDIRNKIGTLYDRVSYGHERIKITRNGKPSLAIVTEDDLHRLEKLDQDTLDQNDTDRIDRIYKGLSAMFGMAKEPIADASTTIDDVLYGREVVKKGKDE